MADISSRNLYALCGYIFPNGVPIPKGNLSKGILSGGIFYGEILRIGSAQDNQQAIILN